MPEVPSVKVIFLDAVGTLFDVRGSVGDIYASFAEAYGVVLRPEELNGAFKKTFAETEAAQFDSGLSLETLKELEKNWWRKVVRETFLQVLSGNEFDYFEQFFTQVFDYFGTAEAWVVYPEVIKTLECWLNEGVQLV
ncbi:MAG: hypothetical protein HC810_05345 [Acaryochloridaceae cyanobacterium RL_2_7]|nr:hypothetical protein [Acaryochloridaceae cyanobacterium RL_2_7]